MSSAATIATRELALPAGVEASADGEGLALRWEGRELLLRHVVTAPDLETLQALLNFCYDAGFADASNPRLFVP